MNYIQTLYFDTTKDPFRDFFGWAAPEYHLMGWALSCLQLHKLYRKITLYANSSAAHLLIDTLQLPYSFVHIHDQLSLIHPDLWALPKIYTYSLQDQPFLHIDGDVFLFKPFDSSLLAGELIAQNVEEATEYYYFPTQQELTRYFTFFPSCVKKDFESGKPIQACNAGVLGGNNMSFFLEYTSTVFEYIRKNADHLKNINANRFNVFFEQHLFYALAKEKGIPISVVIDEIIKDNGYSNMGDFHDVPFHRSYLHLLGEFKKDEFTCIHMAAKLRELYPEYYERIVTLFHKKNIQLSPCGFSNGTKRVDEQTNTHLQLLKHIAGNCPPNIEKEMFQSDFETFYQLLMSFLTVSDTAAYCIERDVVAQNWYHDLFADMSCLFSKIVVRCAKTEMIESFFNWAGLVNKNYRVGIGYYLDLQIEKGRFFNLIIPEASDNGFSLYDMNEIDNAIFQLLSKPISIQKILVKMQDYFENDVLINHYEEYKELIISSIKEFVLKKTIRLL